LIFVLGKEVAKFLSATSNNLACWKSFKDFKTIDGNGNQIIDAIFKNGVKSKLVLLTHPSFRTSNVHRRTYLNYEGHEAEVKMTQAAIEM
jgi:hypothetical protein